MGILGTVESEAGSRLAEVGMQLALLGGVALILGALRLLVAQRTGPRLCLAGGLCLFGLGMALQNLVALQVLELDYYPGWQADREDIFYEEDPDQVFSDDDLQSELGPPAWWEGAAWWGERVGLLAGSGLAAWGFLGEARWLQQRPAGRRKAKSKRVARR